MNAIGSGSLRAATGRPSSRSRRRRPVDARQDLDQRRLAGAVLAEQRMDFAAPDVEVDLSSASVAVKRLLSPASTRRAGHRRHGPLAICMTILERLRGLDAASSAGSELRRPSSVTRSRHSRRTSNAARRLRPPSSRGAPPIAAPRA